MSIQFLKKSTLEKLYLDIKLNIDRYKAGNFDDLITSDSCLVSDKLNLDYEALQSQLNAWRAQGLSIGFVPTMGGLHDGHCSLMRQATTRCDRLLVSIFVNPSQFAVGEDLEAYPRDAESDTKKALDAGADLVWFGQASDIYPEGWCSTLVPSGVGLGLETDHRPHFFTGVATVVARLFSLVRPQIAVFGEKDYQQLLYHSFFAVAY